MRLFGATDVGRVRRDNQDNYAFRTLKENGALLAVCDGMGGARAGQVASTAAVETFFSTVEEACVDGAPDDPAQRTELLLQACYEANHHVYSLAESREDYEGMGTTLVAALVFPGEAYVLNVGDSRCYLIEDHLIRQVTVDHSLVQMMVDRGEITKEEARNHPKKNLITRAVGVDREVNCDVHKVQLGQSSRLLLCSDGLTNVLTDSVLLQESDRQKNPEQFAKTLIDLTLEHGAPDNITVVLAQME